MEIKKSAAIITGGVSGLGAAVARTLIDDGARVALLDLNQELGEQMAAELGEGAMFLPVNVADHTEVDAAVDKVTAAYGGIARGSVDRSRLWGRRESSPLSGSQISYMSIWWAPLTCFVPRRRD